ncbi:MAG: hypothetical protein AAGA68_11845 [Pseudomonadota bacterium]
MLVAANGAVCAHAAEVPRQAGGLGSTWAVLVLFLIVLVAVAIAYWLEISASYEGEAKRPKGTLDDMLLRYVERPPKAPPAGLPPKQSSLQSANIYRQLESPPRRLD